MVRPPAPPPAPTSHWRTPSAAVQAKFNLRPLSDDFEPTREEEELLKMYGTIRAYEKEASRIKEREAKAKLAAADAKFLQSKGEGAAPEEEQQDAITKNKTARRKKTRREARAELDDTPHNDETETEVEAEDADTLRERREAKLIELREMVEEAKHSAEAEAEAAAEALRQEHLDGNKVDSTGISLKRKRQEAPKEKASLIANLGHQATPPHEFSQELGLKSYAGKVLFPTSTETTHWSPPESAMSPNEGALTLELADFDIEQAQAGKGNNTLAIKFMAHPDSNRFSLNIAAPDNQDFYDVLLHFNPRQYERGGQVVLNDKQAGIWGQGVNIPLSQLPLMFGQTACTLEIQINSDGFDLFLEGEHCARLEHRRPFAAKGGPLVLQFPSTDDYGNLEAWTVYRVWWGNKASMVKGDISRIPGVNVFSGLHPRKLFVSGLPRINTEAEVELRRAELERAFRKYGGDCGVIATVPTNTTFAFVELESDRQSDLALREMQHQYRLNRARRSRHEALQEERAGSEAAKQGIMSASVDWD